MSIHQDLALPRNLLDYIAERDAIVSELEVAHAAIGRAEKIMESVKHYGLPSHSIPKNSLERSIKEVDQQFWRTAFDVTGFLDVMDATEKGEFFKSMESGSVPVFGEDAIRSTFVELAGKRDEMFRRGVVRVFQRLSGNYHSHSAFKVQRKMILSGFCRPCFATGAPEVNNYSFGHMTPSDMVNDIDRVLCALEDKPHKPRILESAMNTAWRGGEVFDDGRLKARAFKNQNVHLEIRQDLINGVNRIIAEHYGATIGAEECNA